MNIGAAGLASRRAAATDVPALAELYVHSARQLGPQVYSPEQVLAWQSFAEDAAAFANYVLTATTWLCEDKQGPLGFCGVDSQGEVRSLYVRAWATRKGVGSALLEHALADARRRGQSCFAAWATPFSLQVFSRAGFRQVRSVLEPFQGVIFERRRVELGPSAGDA